MLTAGTWTTIDPSALRPWVTARMSGPPPSIYHLASVPPPDAPRTPPFLAGIILTRRIDSGIAELVLRGDQLPHGTATSDVQWFPAVSNDMQRVLDFGLKEDPGRVFGDREWPDPRSQFWEYRSLVPPHVTAQEPMPVIGPGGRITIANAFRGSEPALEVDIVIRKRLGSVPASWRLVDEILAPVRRELEPDLSTVKIHTAFGYFELSKYERQDLMRPAFVFVLTSEDTSESRVPWQYTIVEAATASPQVPSSEGLGSWATE